MEGGAKIKFLINIRTFPNLKYYRANGSEDEEQIHAVFVDIHSFSFTCRFSHSLLIVMRYKSNFLTIYLCIRIGVREPRR